jgi:hypothetical protein
MTTPFIFSEPFIFPDILSDISEHLEKTDDDGVLQTYSYKTCSSDSLDKVKNSRGLIFCGQTPIFRSIGYTQEYSVDDPNVLDIVRRDFSTLTFFPSHEGTLLRVFYSGKWYISTHRKLNAYESRWGSSESFGKTFETAVNHLGMTIEELLANLDQQHVYLFFLGTTPENRIVSMAPTIPVVVHTATLLKGDVFSLTHPSPLRHPGNVGFASAEETISYVKSVNLAYQQGVIAFYPDGRHFKIMNGRYQLYSQARGNEASVMFRYLQIRSNPVYLRLFNEMYPDKLNSFISYENAIFRIAKSIHSSYIARFVNKKQTIVSQEEYSVIRKCHGWHIASRETNKVTLSVVVAVLSACGMESTLNTMIKRLLKTGSLSVPGMTLPVKTENVEMKE